MKLLIISDTHRAIINPLNVLKKINKKINGVIHLGDGADDVTKLKNNYPELEFYNICGNCDFGSNIEQEKVIDLNGKRIFITHGHIYSVDFGLDRIYYAAQEKNADICLFGHTHKPLIEYADNILIMNPGSISKPRSSNICSYGIIDISDNGIITPSIVGIYGDACKVMEI